MNLYIMRHGETDWNKQGLMQGSADIPLNEYGTLLAKKTRDGLKKDHIIFDKIFTSPYQRAVKTAEIIGSSQNTPVIIDQRIREMCFGKYEGIVIRELRSNPEYKKINQCFDDPENYEKEENAESYDEVFARLNSFITQTILPLENTCDNVLVVCHGAVIRGFLSIIKNLPRIDYWRIHQPNCCINIAQVKNKQITMIKEGIIYYEPKILTEEEKVERRFV